MIGMAVVLVVVLGAYLLVKPTNAPQTTPAIEVTPAAESNRGTAGNGSQPDSEVNEEKSPRKHSGVEELVMTI